ncbi:MAG: diguanylate cyclase [Myxococcales bacterium]|nr:diguanylate cyclase [Myxococcales bacterium]
MATILVIDDSEKQRAEIRAAVADCGLFDRILEAADGIRGLKLLVSEPIDAVLCDLEMPGLDGEKLLRVKRESPGHANLPFLFLTASTDHARRARLLEDGACDAIQKPFHKADLVARLQLHMKVKRLQDELMVKNATLAKLSTVDALTGLRTRRYVTELLSIEVIRARRYKTPLSVLMADIDHFKRVNDAHGHPTGDAVLRGVSESLTRALRATDTAGRYGGEEILVVLPQNDLKGSMVFAERWRSIVEESVFKSPDGAEIQVTISIGVAQYHDRHETPDDLIAAADKLLYVAKDGGRNRVESL